MRSAAVNFATTRAYVAYDPSVVEQDALCDAVAGAGYSASPLTDDHRSEAGPSDHWAGRAAVSWVLGIIAFCIAMFGPETGTAGWSVLALAATVEIVGGWPFLKAAFKQLRHGATSMDTLIVVGTLAALAVSAVEAIALGGRHVHLGGGGAFAAATARCDGPAHHLDPGDWKGDRAAGPQEGDACDALASRAQASDRAGRRRPGGRDRRARTARERPGRSARPGPPRRDDPPRRNRRDGPVRRRRVDAHGGAVPRRRARPASRSSEAPATATASSSPKSTWRRRSQCSRTCNVSSRTRSGRRPRCSASPTG